MALNKENTACAESLAGRIAMPSVAQSVLAPSRRVAAEAGVDPVLKKVIFLLGQKKLIVFAISFLV
ncbi:hypothetical protein M7775_15570 [Sporomusa sphaeroides DSM 2875]|uniref:hypothetical protein n=1 Tax=Sporomusa sphaeroides TaxID=47679 RepID=UPI0009519FF0|nr:hypothetical protein [Sporomusa sphaeroides]MCM0759975.1 hypothetical protein [Sporomusa sphaeroides DSM 2875]